MGFFSKRIIGLEIDSKEIRAVEIKGTVKKPVISAWGKAELPEGVIKDGRVVDPKTLTVYLEKLWSDTGLKTKDVFLGINNQDVIIRFASFPKVSEDKIRNMIMFQAQEHIPVPLEELQLDYVIVGEKKNESGQFINVILVGARKRMLHEFVSALTEAKLKVTEIDSSMLAVGRACLTAAAEDVFAVIGYNQDIANIMIFNENVLSVARSVSFSQSSINRRNIEPGPDKSNESLISELLFGELNSSAGYFRMQTNKSIDGVYLIGQSKAEKIAHSIGELAGLEVKIPKPYLSIEPGEKARNQQIFKSSDYIVPISLALRGLE